jgi:hypothetical protein
VRLEAAAGGFDFRKLGHRRSLARPRTATALARPRGPVTASAAGPRN